MKKWTASVIALGIAFLFSSSMADKPTCNYPQTTTEDGSNDGADPQYQHKAVDWCRDDFGKNCGAAAAIEFCKLLGLKWDDSTEVAPKMVNDVTVIPLLGRGCTDAGTCVGFSRICCKPSGSNSGRDPVSGSGTESGLGSGSSSGSRSGVGSGSGTGSGSGSGSGLGPGSGSGSSSGPHCDSGVTCNNGRQAQ